MKNKIVKQIFLIGEVIIGLMGLTLAWFWKALPPQVPWFYSLPSGEQQLVDKLTLVVVIIGLVASLFMTRAIARWAGKEDVPVETAIMTGGLVALILVAASFFRVIQIIIGL